MQTQSDVQDVLILETDRLAGALLAQSVTAIYPKARVRCESEPAAAAALLTDLVDLFIVGLRGFDLDIITLLGVWAKFDGVKTRVLVVTPNANSASVAAISGLPITGVFDSTRGDIRAFQQVLRRIGGEPAESLDSQHDHGVKSATVSGYTDRHQLMRYDGRNRLPPKKNKTRWEN